MSQLGSQTNGERPVPSENSEGRSFDDASNEFTERSAVATKSVMGPGAHWAWLFKALEQFGSNLKFNGEILYEGRHT